MFELWAAYDPKPTVAVLPRVAVVQRLQPFIGVSFGAFRLNDSAAAYNRDAP